MSAPGAATEEAGTFSCEGEALIGILHRPAPGAGARRRGILVVAGAPQYRVGSHRQFVLLARALCAAGFPVLRFDYRGMGDSDGAFRGFERVERDIAAAVDHLFERVEGLSDAVLWGLCDGASAACFYAARDPRVSGLIILNPWVRTGQGLARARLGGYYLQRLVSRAFWRKLLGGKLAVTKSLRELAGAAVGLLPAHREPCGSAPVYSPAREGAADLPQRVSDALRRFEKPTLVILSGADLTATEFRGTVVETAGMRAWTRRADVALRALPEANHTYATSAWRDQVHAWCIEWLNRG